jgi:hypothetical protein
MSRLLRCQGIKPTVFVLPLVALTSLLSVAAPQVITRTWKSSDGVYSINAEYVEAKDGKVSLRKPNGAVIEVPLARLSAEDQAYVAKQSIATDRASIPYKGDILEDYRRIKAEYDASTGSFSRDVNAESAQATTPTWANQEPDPTYDDPEEQAIMSSRNRYPENPTLDLYSYFQAEKSIRDLREQKSAAIGQKNLEARNEFLRGLYRGFDTLQATYQSGLGKLSSLVGDETSARKYLEAYQDEMRQASENPRNAPTFENMIDDPLGWWAATAGEYALQTVFCTSICAGVLFWISKQRSKKSQRNSERGFATLVDKETFFWVREFQYDKVVYTYRNYIIFYFLILPLLIAFIGVPVIGLIPILAWTFYWVFYPRPNFELSQMLKQAQCVATGSKLSSVNPMRLTFSRADFDRIVMGRESTTAETTPSSTAPTLLSTHSDSISSDAELESLRKTNEELKRKVEARKLAEKQANDRAALEAENARLMQQLGEGTVSSDLSSDVRPSNVANRNLADRKISGVGGWLALLVAGMLVLGPFWSMFKTGSNIWVTEMQTPELASVPQWQTYKIMTWFVVGICVVYSMVSGFLLCVKKEPVSVKNAIAFLWIGGPVAVFVLSVLIPGISLGTEALEEMLPKSIGAIIGTSIVASIWTAYLRKSKRVRNTYYP